MLDRAARREYNRLVEAAVDAVPATAPKGVFTFMRRRVKKELAYGAERYGWEFMLMSHLWALMGYQDAVRLLCEAMLYRAVNSEPGREAPNGISYAALAWPAEYVNLIGYAHLFNRTTTPFTTLSKEIEPIYTTTDFHTRNIFGTPDQPGDTIKELLVPLTRQVIDEMVHMSIFRLSANGNDLGWDRARLDEELERDARALRNVLGTNPETPHLPQDLNITLPEGFNTLHSNIGPNQAAPGLQHLPPPHPLPTNLFPPNWFTTPAPQAPSAPTPASQAPSSPAAPAAQTPTPQPKAPLPPANGDIGVLWEQIQALLGEEAHTILNPGASEDDVAQLETHLGHKLPTELRDSLKRHNGMSEEHELLPGLRLLSTEEIAEEWDTNNEAYEDTNHDVLASPHPATATNFTPGTTQPGIWNTAWIPLTTDGLGNNLTTDLDPGPHGTPGQILTINHDQPHTGPSHPNLAALLTTWANNLND